MEKIPNFPLDPSLKNLQIGYRFDDRFEISGKPVRRSHCFAFKVNDLQENQPKVVLLFPQRIKRDPEALRYLTEQILVLTALDHAQIARIYGIHTNGPLGYIETEYVAGNTLKTLKLKKEQQRFNEEEVRWIAGQTLDALEYAHNLNILHRDLKPANIILTAEQKIHLIDFGLSEPVRQAMNLVQDATASTIILYWSPEQVQGKALTVQSDLYTLGAVMYDLLNGKPPFFTGDVYNNILYKEPEPIAHCSGFMNDVLLKALAKKPEERFQNCQEMRQALEKTGISYFSSSLKMEDKAPPAREKKKKTGRGLRTLLKPQIRYGLMSALLIVLLTVMISRLQFGTHDAPQADSSAVDRQTGRPDSFQVKMLNALLDQAQEKIARKQILSPPQNNAMFLLQQAQKIDPHNHRLKSLQNEVKSALRQQVYLLSTSGRQVQGLELLNNALKFFPDDSLMLRLKNELFGQLPRQMPLKVEILNGAGVSGIAHRLSRFLQNRGVVVVNTENFRTDGRVNWNVPNSFIKGNLPENEAVKKLEELLGLNYRQEASFKGQNPAARISIVLGKDYQTLKPFRK
ncbi:protein kinase domain-containing protein [Caldithrix abyssi]